MVELKSCPFCGGEGEIIDMEVQHYTQGFVASCKKCDCTIGLYMSGDVSYEGEAGRYSTKQQAIDAWNRRV